MVGSCIPPTLILITHTIKALQYCTVCRVQYKAHTRPACLHGLLSPYADVPRTRARPHPTHTLCAERCALCAVALPGAGPTDCDCRCPPSAHAASLPPPCPRPLPFLTTGLSLHTSTALPRARLAAAWRWRRLPQLPATRWWRLAPTAACCSATDCPEISHAPHWRPLALLMLLRSGCTCARARAACGAPHTARACLRLTGKRCTQIPRTHDTHIRTHNTHKLRARSGGSRARPSASPACTCLQPHLPSAATAAASLARSYYLV